MLDVPTRHEETFVAQYANLDRVVATALVRLGWRVTEASPSRWRARVAMNSRSWGEVVTVTVAMRDTIHVTSVCVFPLQIVDWGKNRRNVERLKAEIHEIGNAAPR